MINDSTFVLFLRFFHEITLELEARAPVAETCMCKVSS